MLTLLFLVSTVSAQMCSTDADCEEGSRCADYVFYGLCEVTCMGAATAANYSDADAYCQDVYGAIYLNGAFCNETSGDCQEEAGAEGCDSYAVYCQTMQLLSTQQLECVEGGADGPSCEAVSCSSDDDCTSPYTCSESICQEATGCSTDEDCTTLYGAFYACNQDTAQCEFDYSYDSCTEDADCAEGTSCDETTGVCVTAYVCDEEECKSMYSELATCSETLAICMDNECLDDEDCVDDEVCSTTLALSYEPYQCVSTCSSDDDCDSIYSCVNFAEISGVDVSICSVSTSSATNFTFNPTFDYDDDVITTEQKTAGNDAAMLPVAMKIACVFVFAFALL